MSDEFFVKNSAHITQEKTNHRFKRVKRQSSNKKISFVYILYLRLVTGF